VKASPTQECQQAGCHQGHYSEIVGTVFRQL